MVLVKFEVPPRFDPAKADERIFYFAVYDWYIRGRCYCHGQSGECNAEVRGIFFMLPLMNKIIYSHLAVLCRFPAN